MLAVHRLTPVLTPRRLSLAAPVAGGFCLLAWASTLADALLALIPVAAVATLLAGRRHGARWPVRAAAGVLMLGAAVAAGTEWRLRRIARDWDAVATERRREAAESLVGRLERRVEEARRTLEAAASAAGRAEGSSLFTALAALASEAGVALAVLDPAGELVAWAGDHRGALPDRLRSPPAGSVLYAERPLFSYLYLTRPLGERGRVAVALLLETDPALPGARPRSFADEFERRTGLRPRFHPGGSAAPTDWQLAEDGGGVAVSAVLESPSQGALRGRSVRAGKATATLLALLALGLVMVSWRGRRADGAGGVARSDVRLPGLRSALLPLAALAALLLVAPLDELVGGAAFSPAMFLLPGPLELSLGDLLLVAALLGALAALGGEPRWARLHPGRTAVVGVAVVATGYPFLIHWLLRGASPELLRAGAMLWSAFQLAVVLLLGVVTALVLPSRAFGATTTDPRPSRAAALLGALVSAGLLALVLLLYMDARSGPSPLLASLWVVPYVLAAGGLWRPAARASRLLRWSVAVWLAGTAVLPQLQAANVRARFDAAEADLRSLGLRDDPFLDYLLHRFAEEADVRARLGEGGRELLYRAWVASGLAEEAYPARITLWGPDDQPRVRLEVGHETGATPRSSAPSAAISDLVRRARAAGEPVLEVASAPSVSHAMALPLTEGQALSIAVPPRRSLEAGSALLAPVGEPRPETSPRLTLVPVTSPQPGVEGGVSWHPAGDSWRSEAVVSYPEGSYHAHMEVRAAPTGVKVARGVLLLALDVGLATLLWLVGRIAGREPPAPRGGWRRWQAAFRARVTVALFAFFLAPTLVFGAVAYQALAGEVVRTSRLTAQRAAAQAVAHFESAEGDLIRLAELTGADVLFYHRGELAAASSPEAFDLGLYGAWMPAGAYRALATGEEVAVVEERLVLGRPYVVAYHRLPPAGTLGVPVSLSAEDIALRQAELAHVVLFAALLGGLLSLTLSVAVGRELAGPIGRLRLAAGAVGEGRLDVRLPQDREDEFGELYASFNRMTTQLRKARARELRSARILAWGEMARQVAHEIKNPLTPIKLSIQHIRRAFGDRRADFPRIMEENIRQILTEIDRLSEIARAFSRYGSPTDSAGPLEEVDVAGTVRDVLSLYRSAAGEISYQESLPEPLPPVRSRTGELKEVLVNLLENARAAIGDGGHIAVAAQADDARVHLFVEDDGEGIPPELMHRVFDPQFSTRSSGTGLGLAIVRRLVEGWGGEVGLHSERGRGTLVRVSMLRAEGKEGD